MNRLITLIAQIDIDRNDFNIPKGDLGNDSVANGLQLVFGVAGGVALIIVTIAGFKYVLSQGNPQETAKAKNTILYALIGLVVIILGYSIVAFTVNNI